MDFDSIINSSKNIVPKRLSFDFLNASPNTTKKRKYAEVEEPLNSSKNDTLNSSSGSLCASWETKLLRSDLIEAQSRVKPIFNSTPSKS